MNQKRKTNLLMKKSAAIVMAATMVMAVPVTAMAEGTTYQDREKAALKSLCESLVKDWDASLEKTTESGNYGKMDMTLTLSEAGQSIVGMLTQMDASWLKSIGLNMDVSIADSKETVKADIFLNDTGIGTMNVLLDLLKEAEYIQIPELSPSWIKADLDVTANGEEVSAESMETIMGIASDPSLLLPEGKTVSELLERYGNIVIDHMQEGSSTDEAISIDGISEDCTLLEGQIFQNDLREMVQELLTTAQGDEQLKELLTKWSEAMPETGDLNEQFQSFAQDTLDELNEYDDTDETNDEYLVSRIWVNGDDKIVGREFAVCEGIDTEAVLTWKAPSNGDAAGFLFDMQSDGSGFSLIGSGQNTDGVKNGNYSFVMDGVTVMDIVMESESANSAVYTVTFPQGETEEEYNPLSMFSLVLTASSDETGDNVELNLEVLSSGASLGELNIQVTNSTEAVEAVSEEDMETVYDALNDEDMAAYEEEMNFDTILANAESAGVPADLVSVLEQSIEAAMTGETEDSIEGLEEYTEESVLDEITEETEDLDLDDAA